jgi:hypothetical protein
MFGRMDLGGERVMRFSRLDGHPALAENGAAVHLGRHVMDRAARLTVARAQGLADSVQARELREESGMKVDDAPLKGAEEPRLQDPHESREYNQVRSRPRYGRDEAGLAFALELGPEGRRVDEGGRHAESRTEPEDPGVGDVRKDRLNPRLP